jgi:hypothetical protein
MTLATEVNKTSIQQCLLVDIELNSTTTYYVSNNYQNITYNGNDYTQLGYFLQMSELQDDIKPTNNQIQIAMAGVPSNVVPDFPNIALNSTIKGSKIKIYRAFFNNNVLVDAYLRFSGYVSNYSLNETWEDDTRLTSFSISLQCSNLLALLERQYSGRRTNEKDQKLWYPTDTGMDRVKVLADSSFDFGKKN